MTTYVDRLVSMKNRRVRFESYCTPPVLIDNPDVMSGIQQVETGDEAVSAHTNSSGDAETIPVTTTSSWWRRERTRAAVGCVLFVSHSV